MTDQPVATLHPRGSSNCTVLGLTSSTVEPGRRSSPQSTGTYLYRVPQCTYIPSSELGPAPPPLPQASVPPRNQRVGGRGGTLTCGWGSPNSDDWRKRLALCLLCAPAYIANLCSPEGIDGLCAAGLPAVTLEEAAQRV
jgi:hypothetical protein